MTGGRLGNPSLRILFMGTPEFALPSLQRLLKSHHKIVAVVTVPDVPQGRGQKLQASPVKRAALNAGLPVLQPLSLNDPEFLSQLCTLEPDLGVVVAFRILPKSVFELPPLGTVNLHASLLPKYRGAAPIQWALINGEQVTGVTTFFIREKVDTGSIIIQRSILIGEDETAGELHDRLAVLGAEVMEETVDLIARGEVKLQEQDDLLATAAPKITKEMCEINWKQPARRIHNLIRALSPEPGAFTFHEGRILKIYRTHVIADEGVFGAPGTVLRADFELHIAADPGALSVLQLQVEGRKILPADAFLRGYSLRAGESLGLPR